MNLPDAVCENLFFVRHFVSFLLVDLKLCEILLLLMIWVNVNAIAFRRESPFSAYNTYIILKINIKYACKSQMQETVKEKKSLFRKKNAKKMRFVVKKKILGEYVVEFCCFGRIKHVLSLAEKECEALGKGKH